MKALVKGGVGFTGSHLVDLLISQNCEVVLVDNHATGYFSQLPQNALFLKGDVENEEFPARALSGCDAVFHLVGVSSV